MITPAEIFKQLELAQQGAVVKKESWGSILESIPYIIFDDANADDDEMYWGYFQKNRADMENDPPDREDIYFSFKYGNIATLKFPSDCEERDQEGTWNEILLEILKYLNKHLHLPKLETTREYHKLMDNLDA